MNRIDLDNNFFGRKSIIDLLKRRVIDLKEGYRQNIAFLGNRFVGKTSILRSFITNLDDPDIVKIYVDLDDKDIEYFFYKFAGSMLYNFSRLQQLPLHEDLALLMESTKKLIPQTIEAIEKIRLHLSKGRLADSYRDLISLPETFTLESGKFCMIALDEFHCLADFGIANAFQELGKKIMTQKRCIYIVSSSRTEAAQEILSEKLSLLFGHFEMVDVAPFDLANSRSFIEHNLKDVRMSRYLKNFLIDFTGGHPLYLNMICQELAQLSAIHKQEEIFLPLLTQAVENTLFSRWGILSRHFELVLQELCSGKGNRLIAHILIALANGRHKLDDIIKALESKKNTTSQKLNRLTDAGIVVKNGTIYYFQDKLLKYWVKYIFQQRLRAIDTDGIKQTRRFREEFQYLFSSFQIVSQKDVSSRVVELLHCFDNEAFRLNGKRYKLPLFRDITMVACGEDGAARPHIIRASSQEGVWFIILKEDTLSEHDVTVFLDESHKVRQKLQRRVIISLSDLDANARLKALQEKMWIWSEGEVNALLSFYDKPYIVR